MTSYMRTAVFAFLLIAAAVAQEEEVDAEGRTFGHLAKPLKKWTNRLGQYLVHATNDYSPHNFGYPSSHYNHYGGYDGNYGYNGYVGLHRPGLGGYRDFE